MQIIRLFTALLLAVLATCSSSVFARPAGGARTLVIVENSEAKGQYSKFLTGLTERGHELTYKTATESDFGLVVYEEIAFDHVLVLAPTVGSFGGELGIGNLMEFVSKGGNVLIAASSQISEAIRDFAYEFSVDFDESGSGVQDHFLKIEQDDPTLISVSNGFVGNSVAVAPSVAKGPPILFRGVGHRLTGKNPLIQALLVGAPTTFASEIADKDVLEGSLLVGKDVVLVSALQARNNARVTFAGSVEMFSDALIERQAKGAVFGNGALVEELAKWTFHEKGVLKVLGKKHHRVNETDQHGIYRIKDDMVYEISISEWTGKDWDPFQATDMQFEAVMLDPYIRTPLRSSTPGTFAAQFRLPDHYGVFTFKVDYRRHGYTWVTETETVQVRPYRHDQYPRFLTAAMPYYVNVFSLAAAFVLFSAVFLWNRDVPNAGAKKLKTT
ncbi:Dolichyl-diphosphooligosaccharide--protein glycosyltransferase subunit WBP1 [Powellomyces hirtus]|nr:Dolichyl-diphosphooligosaccharide--protein glycosyltransferase subunit WBP1 [Powellomyces hirtus]